MTEKKKDARLTKAGVSGYNKPKRTPSHPTKSHVVVAKEGDKVKTIRFGEQGAKTAGAPKQGESEKMKKKRASRNAARAALKAGGVAVAGKDVHHKDGNPRNNKRSNLTTTTASKNRSVPRTSGNRKAK